MNTYTLQCGDWLATVCPQMGSNLIGLRHKDFPILREPETLQALQGSPVLYGFPLLLPPNRTSGGTFVFEGKKYTLPVNEVIHNNHLHGFLHSAPFRVISHTQDQLVTEFENDGTGFPFPFRIEITDRLLPEGLHRSLTVTNTGSQNMPLTLAVHTTFTQPESFSVPIESCWLTNEHHIPTGETAPLTEEQRTFRDGCVLTGQVVTGFFKAAGDTARIGNYRFRVEGFDQWIFYNDDGKQNYLCVEPQLGPVNALNSGGYYTLKPGESYRFRLLLTL